MAQDPDDAQLQREIRDGRQFTLAEAIGRLGGSGVMKGASPVAGRREAEAAIGEAVRRHLPDRAGALATTLIRTVTASEDLDRDPHHPIQVLTGVIDRHLAHAELLADLVRAADQEWGGVMGERPYFERSGAPPDPADPYTQASVRAALVRLRQALAEA
jgi:hypothetical protein